MDEISRELVDGWAIDWEQPTSACEVIIAVDGMEAGRCAADVERKALKQALGDPATGFHAFRYRFDPPLDRLRNHTIEVVAAPHHVLLPNGRRTVFKSPQHRSAFTPILLTSSGRSGSTMLMQEFATHPDIVISNIYPFEVKLASYYAAALNVLTASSFLTGDVEQEFARHASVDCLIGRNPWNRPNLLTAAGDDRTASLISTSFPDRLEDLLRSIVEEYYSTIASANHLTARLFAEKSPIDEPVRQACRVLFGAVREIVLVRDPRDYLCSANSFWKTRLDAAMMAMRSEHPVLMRIFRSGQPDVLFIRYEDLILDGAATRQRMYDFLGCTADFTPRANSAAAIPASHRTSHSAAASIGRFRTELDQATIARCEEMYRPFMTLFDYT